jgi:hypothetical protein
MPKQILIFLALLCLVFGVAYCADDLSGKDAKTAGDKQLRSMDKEEPLVVDKVIIKQEQTSDNDQIDEEDTKPETSVQGGNMGRHDVSQVSMSEQVATPNKPSGNEGMVVPGDWVIDGTIVGEKDKKLLIAAGDTVYVNLGSDKVNTGDQCIVYRKTGSIKDPKDSGESLGLEVQRVGKLEIVGDPGKDVSSAKVIVSYAPLEIGDGVKIVLADDK